jgi:menaquinone-dependent protoporphyrinogen IX oxidase
MEPNILVTWATRAGSAAGVAERIGTVLAETGAHVDILPLREVGFAEQYTAIDCASTSWQNSFSNCRNLASESRELFLYRLVVVITEVTAYQLCFN